MIKRNVLSEELLQGAQEEIEKVRQLSRSNAIVDAKQGRGGLTCCFCILCLAFCVSFAFE